MSFLKSFFNKKFVLGKMDFEFTNAQLLFKFILPALLVFFIYKILMYFFKKLFETSIKEDIKRSISLKWIRRFLKLISLGFIIFFFNNLFKAGWADFFNNFIKILNKPFVKLGSTNISLLTLFLLILAFYVSSWAGSAVRRGIENSYIGKLKVDESKKKSITNLSRYLTMILTFLLCLAIIGIDISSIGVALSVLGISVGFGLRDLISNFFAGIVILFTRPLKEGDRLFFDGHEGTVVTVRLMSTIIEATESKKIIVPNSKLVNETIYNFHLKSYVIANSVQVSYESDLDEVIEIMEGIGKSCPYGVKNSEVVVRVTSFDDSGITMTLRTTIEDIYDKYVAKSWVNLEIWRVFRDKNISIPFPHLVIANKEEALDEKSVDTTDVNIKNEG